MFSDLKTQIVVRFPEAVTTELEAVAQLENVRKSDVIRYATIRYLMERREASGNV